MSKRNSINAEVLGSVKVQKSRPDLLAQPVEHAGPGKVPLPYNAREVTNIATINAYHVRCVELKAQLTVGLGYALKPKVEGTKNDADIKKFAEFERRHAEQSLQPFSETLVNWFKDFENYGNGYLEVVRNNKGEIAELYHIMTRDCYLVAKTRSPKDKSLVITLHQVIGGEKAEFVRFNNTKPVNGVNQYLHLKNYTVASRYYGLPDYLTTYATMVLDRNAVEFNVRKFDNNAVPDHVLLTKGGKIDPDSKKKIKEFFETNFKGVDKVGKLLHVNMEDPEGMMELKAVTEAVKEASFHVLRMDCKEEIVDAHGVPRRLVGIASAGKLGDAKQTREEMQLFRDVMLLPRKKRVEFIFNEMILPGMGINDSVMDFTVFDISDDIEDAEYYTGLVGAGIVEPDEARPFLGFTERVTKSGSGAIGTVKDLIQLREMLTKVKGLF